MSNPHTRLRNHLFGARPIFLLVTGLVLASVFAGGVVPASAADVDLTVNVTSDRGSYETDQPAVYTVRVDNRSDQATAAGATATLDVPNMAGSAATWETSVSAVQTGGGAAAPMGFIRSADGRAVTATLPAIPAGGWVSYSLTAPGHPTGGITGALTVTATVASASGDTDVDTATDTATVGVVINARPADYATSITNYPTSGIADGATITADVSLVNTGVRNNLSDAVVLGGNLGNGSQLVSAQLLSGPGASPVLTPGTTGSLGVAGMPAGSTSVFRLTIAVGATCNPAGTPRTMTLTSLIGPAGGIAEAPALNGDNTAVATFSVLTPACQEADVRVDALEQVTPAAPAVLPHDGPFAFRAVYANTGPDTAPSTIRWSLTWATGEGAPAMPANPVCVAAGGAVCPTSWEISPSVTPGPPGLPSVRGQSAVAAIGSGAVVPAGGTLTITYAGTGGAEDNLICGDRPGSVFTSITPAPSFTDAIATNNFTNLTVGEDIGIACGISHDFQLTVPWFRNDPNGTPLPQTTQDFAPGDTAYFDITGLNASNPDQAGLGVDGTAPYVDLNGYSEISRFGMLAAANIISGNQQFDLSDPGNVFWQSDAGSMEVDPGFGLDFRSDSPLNITCQSAAPVVCPDIATSRGITYPGQEPYPFNFDINWSNQDQTVLPAGSTLRLTAGFKVPDLPEQYRVAGCVPQGVLIGGSPTATSMTMSVILLNFAEQTTKLSGEVGTIADRWRGVQIRVNYTRCTQDLEIEQTIVDAAGAPIASPTLPVDRAVRYRVTITNPAGSAPLALPRFTEAFGPAVASATVTCDPSLSTGGAVCPTGTFMSGTRYLADGSTQPVAPGDPQIDISWGATGAPTLPAGSSVTFFVDAQYPPETATTVTATASAFDAAPGSPFPLVSDSDAVAPQTSSAVLSIRKSVTPIDPHPGDTVSFVVDLLNAGNAPTPAFFDDPLHPDLAAANPDGFANVTCTPITAAMNLLDGPLGTTPCPTLTSDAAGIRAAIASFAPNSGLRITYTAVAPSNITSTPNIANVYADATLATSSDRSAWVNFLVRPLPAVVPPTPTDPTPPGSGGNPTLANTGLDSLSALNAVAMGIVALLAGVLLVIARRMVARRPR